MGCCLDLISYFSYLLLVINRKEKQKGLICWKVAVLTGAAIGRSNLCPIVFTLTSDMGSIGPAVTTLAVPDG